MIFKALKKPAEHLILLRRLIRCSEPAQTKLGDFAFYFYNLGVWLLVVQSHSACSTPSRLSFESAVSRVSFSVEARESSPGTLTGSSSAVNSRLRQSSGTYVTPVQKDYDHRPGECPPCLRTLVARRDLSSLSKASCVQVRVSSPGKLSRGSLLQNLL